MKKGMLLFSALLMMVVSGFFGHSLMQVMAEEERGDYTKYYTSIRLEKGDTLWSIAKDYYVNSNQSIDEYIRELRSMNGLSDDTIHAGHYLTVSYYTRDED